MSKLIKTICDNCDKEIDYEDWFYTADITSESNSCKSGVQVMKGDYCKDCFRELILKQVKIKEEQ